MISDKLNQALVDANIRFEKVVPLLALDYDSVFTNDQKEAFDDCPKVWEAFAGVIKEFDTEDAYDDFEIIEKLLGNNVRGILFQFATPVPVFSTSSREYSSSWGYYTMTWVFETNWNKACRKALAWQKAYIKQEKKKFIEQKKLAKAPK